jgi:hypothetical protein
MTISVRVAGWLTPRTIREENGKILFEVAEGDGCPTCAMRIRHVERVLVSKKISAEFRTKPSAYGPRCLYVVLDPPAQGVDIKQHVGSLLDLSLS